MEIRELLLSIYSNAAMSCAAFFEWMGTIREGRECTFDNKQEGRLITARTKPTVAHVKVKINEDRHVSLKDAAGSVGASHETICKILHEVLNLSKVSTHRVLQVLTTN